MLNTLFTNQTSNNQLLVEFFICSRKRPNFLLDTLNSIYNTVNNSKNIGVSIKFDDDDNTSLDNIEKYKIFPNINIYSGLRLCGYDCCDMFSKKMMDSSNAVWFMLFNDDCIIQNYGWDEKLEKIKSFNNLVFPQYHKLDLSIYENMENMAFCFFPNKFWNKTLETIDSPIDTGIYNIAKKNNYNMLFLDDLTIFHNRHEIRNLENKSI